MKRDVDRLNKVLTAISAFVCDEYGAKTLKQLDKLNELLNRAHEALYRVEDGAG